jgi:gas vesicle protein
MVSANQEPQQNHRNHFGSVFAGLLIGGLAGAAAMLLLAPQSGEDTRTQIQAKGIQLRDRTTGMLDDATAQLRSNVNKITIGGREKIEQLRQHGKELAVEQLTRVSEVAQAGKEAIESS